MNTTFLVKEIWLGKLNLCMKKVYAQYFIKFGHIGINLFLLRIDIIMVNYYPLTIAKRIINDRQRVNCMAKKRKIKHN